MIVEDSEPERERESWTPKSTTPTIPSEPIIPAPTVMDPLVFRCIGCKRAAHYDCLPPPADFSGTREDLVEHYQEKWTCLDCQTYQYKVESILAWRPYPENAPQPKQEDLHYRSNLPREYLVKWQTRGYNRCQWASHTWLLAKSMGTLRVFMEKGSRVPLLEKHISPDSAKASAYSSRAQSVSLLLGEDQDAVSTNGIQEASEEVWQASFRADPLAERRIPPAWKTVDRVLDVLFWKPKGKKKQKKRNVKRKSNRAILDSDDEREDNADDDPDPELVRQRLAAQDEGVEPDEEWTEDPEDRQKRTGEEVTMDDIDSVAWVYIKWDELPYEQGQLLMLFRECVYFMIAYSNLGCTSRETFARMESISKGIPTFP
jgi:hypothetical protein